MQIYKMNPVFKEYIWGGNKLKEVYGKDTPFDITAESWEIAAHKNGETTVCGGEDNGLTIKELGEKYKAELLGDKVYGEDYNKFPLLIKLIDARDNLSVQVHPDDEQAKILENGELGKTEMWYVMESEEGASLIYGFRQDITKEQFRAAIEDNTLLDYVNVVKCKKGDCFFIPAGMLHAIGKGLLIAEIQQNSDTTYRVYDYDRRDAQGNARELHIEKAVEVTNTAATKVDSNSPETGILAACEYFTTEKITVNGEYEIEVSRDRFEILIICEGTVTINGVQYKKGDTLLVPAYIGKVDLNGNAVILRSFV